MIGDPGGRSEERNLLDAETLAANVASISAQIERVLGAEGRWILVDNASWTRDLLLLDFLRDIGKHMTVNQMIARESVKQRLASEHGISFTEFSYMLLQAHDYLWLHDHEGCVLQIGGSDQWGNILSGVDLIRRVRGAAVHGLCWPLLTAPGGAKVGKSTGASVWLDPQRTSPYQFWQHWMQLPDEDLRRQLAWFTLLPLDELDAIMAEHERAPERRPGQRRLAHEVTTLVHGPGEAAAAGEAAGAAVRVRRDRRDQRRRSRCGGAGGPACRLGRRVPRGRRRPGGPARADRPGLLEGRRPAPARPGRSLRQRRAGGVGQDAGPGRRAP